MGIYSKEELKEIEAHIDEAIKEAEGNKNFLGIHERRKEDQGVQDMRVYLIDIKEHQVKHHGRSVENFVNLIKELHYIKKYMNRYNYITMAIVLLSGIVIGTQYEAWMPHMNNIFDTLKIISRGA